MTLLITVLAAIIVTLNWYQCPKSRTLGIGTLCLMYWGASLMWLVDAVTEYIELRTAYFQPQAADMMNDAFLGVSVVALGMLIWLARVLIRDPKGVWRRS